MICLNETTTLKTEIEKLIEIWNSKCFCMLVHHVIFGSSVYVAFPSHKDKAIMGYNKYR